MGIEQICVGVVICLVVFIISTIFAAVLNYIYDNDFGYFMSLVIVCVGLGTCITYILYETGFLV